MALSFEEFKQIFKEQEEEASKADANTKATAAALRRERLELERRKLALQERKVKQAEQRHEESIKTATRGKNRADIGILATLGALLFSIAIEILLLLKFFK